MEFVKYLLIGASVSLDELAVGTIKGVQVKHMVREAFSKNDENAKQQDLLARMDVKSMSVLSLTMSLDALAVGVSLALGHRLDIWWASLSAALVSLAITVPAMFVGHKLGHKVGAKGDAFGGAILILLGIYELLQYYKVF